MEDEVWLAAAKNVLDHFEKPLHYTEIKRIIMEQGLVGSGLKMTLEEVLFKEIQKPDGIFKSIAGKPGVFDLAISVKQEPPTIAMQSPGRMTSGPEGQRLAPQGPKAKVVSAESLSHSVQQKYCAKYKKLRKQIKGLIFINAGICDEVVAIEDKIQKVKDERRYLLARLLQHQSVAESLIPTPQSAAVTPGAGASKHTAQSIAQILGEVEKRKKKAQQGQSAAAKRKSGTPEDVSKVKPKKARTNASGRRIVQPLPLDSLGRPVLPIDLGNLTIYCIGEIVPDRTGFHSSEYIFPAGFCSTRVFASVRNPLEQCLYTCKIVDTGTGPKFDISPEDAPEMVFSGFSASECHLKLLKAINYSKPTELVPLAARGADFFGLSHPTVQNLIQSCPGAKKCSQYKWVRFEISKVPFPDTHDHNEPTVSVDTLYKLPVFVSLQKSQQMTQASLRTLLTTEQP